MSVNFLSLYHSKTEFLIFGLPRQLSKLNNQKLKVNFEIYMADRKATTRIKAKLFLLRCINPAVLPLVRYYSIRLPRRLASWVNYSSRRTESSSEHFASDLSLLKADAPW